MRRALALLMAVCVLLGASPALASGMVAGAGRVPLERGLEQRKPRLAEPSLGGEVASGLGIFLQKDPYGFEDSVNLYAFARHDPINNRDPSGREAGDKAAGASFGLVYGPEAVAEDQALCQANVICRTAEADYMAGQTAGASARTIIDAIPQMVASYEKSGLKGVAQVLSLSLGAVAVAAGGSDESDEGPTLEGPNSGRTFAREELGIEGSATDTALTTRKPDKGGRSVGQQVGRENRLDWLEAQEFNPDQPANVRGWLANERRRVAQDPANRQTRTPPGHQMAHGIATPAREGFDYSNAKLSGTDMNRLEEKARRKLRKSRRR